ncbi:MAG: hypothetical protein KC503_21890 [Myxococcales bacterium]|nr:hypothetical protein [Myxococcales bacterium]
MRRAAVIFGALAALAACKGVPSATDAGPSDATAQDIPADLLALYDETRVTVLSSATFGEEDERPVALVAPPGSDEAIAISDKATYRLGSDDRVRARRALPLASSGATALLGDAQHDGRGLVALVAWGDDSSTPAGTYVAYGDSDGRIVAADMLRLGDAGTRARLVDSDKVLITRPNGNTLALERRSAGRDSGLGAVAAVTALPSTTALGAAIGDGTALRACTVGPVQLADGSSHLAARMLFIDGGSTLPRALDLTPSTRQARGGCSLARGATTYAAAFGVAATAPGPDAEPDAVAADPIGVMVLSKAGEPRGSLWVLSQVPTLTDLLQLWYEQSSERYLALYRSAYLGGRLALAAYNEAGEVVFRDALIPLVYEPGGLAPVAAMAPTGEPGIYRVFYGRRLPWEKARMHVARVRVR